LSFWTLSSFYLKQHFGDWTLPASSGEKPTQLGSIDRASPYLYREGPNEWTSYVRAEAELSLLKKKREVFLMKLAFYKQVLLKLCNPDWSSILLFYEVQHHSVIIVVSKIFQQDISCLVLVLVSRYRD
jgi:hypothetical protein